MADQKPDVASNPQVSDKITNMVGKEPDVTGNMINQHADDEQIIKADNKLDVPNSSINEQ